MGGNLMAKLQTEYTDIKGVKHPVEHTTVGGEDKKDREQLLEELYNVLTRKNKRMSP